MAPVDIRAVRAKALMRESTTTTTTTTRDDTLSFAARGGFVDTNVDDDISSSSSPDVARRVPGLAYCREFIGARDAEFIESALLREPAAWWTKGRGRRVMNAGGTSPSRLYREGDDEAIPTYLRELVEVLVRRKASERAARGVGGEGERGRDTVSRHPLAPNGAVGRCRAARGACGGRTGRATLPDRAPSALAASLSPLHTLAPPPPPSAGDTKSRAPDSP